MVHSAYDSFELLSDCPAKIETIESYGAKLLLGCSDGSLRIYAPETSGSDRSPTSDYDTQNLELHKEPYVLERNVVGFSKKPLVSVEVLESRQLLLSLSESIAFHRLPNLETIAVITKAKGANVYCWDDRRGFLCFARQKRVCIFRHDGDEDSLRREYMILNATNGAMSEVFPSGRLAPPLVVSLPSGELLLGKDNIGVFVDQNGKLLQEGRICWSEAPTVVVIQKPYAIAMLPRFVEVRSLRAPYPLIQTVVLRNVRRLIQSNNAVIVALDNSVFGLFPVPLGAQIVQLTASGNFEEALALCKLLPLEDSSLRAAKEGSIHIRYAHYLLIVGTMRRPWNIFGFSKSDESAALQSKKMSHNTLMALIKFLQKKRYSVIEKATAEGTEEVVLDAVGDNFAYMTLVGLKTKQGKLLGRGNIPIGSGAREMAAILDTALLQALLLTGQSSALELLKGLNYCDLKICEEILQKNNHYTALLELYKCNSMHCEALKLLHKLVEDSKSNQFPTELSQKFKPESIIEYLKPLCGTEPMLVLEFSMLVLESCPTQTIELFLSGNIPADLVNSYLKQHAPNMQATYLELMLAVNENGISGNLQNEMVHLYLSEVLDWHTDLSAQQKWDEKDYSPTRKKLLSALEGISGYNPEALLKRLPADALYEERAILLGKMNQHELALSLYVHKLHVPELALSYCDRVYESMVQPSARSSGNIYLTLLQIYLNPQRTTKTFEKRITNLVSPQNISTPKVGSASSVKSKGGRGAKKIAAIEGAEEIRVSPSSTDSGRSDGDADESSEEGGSNIMLDEILDLLSRRWDRINGAQALKLLPRETKLQNLLPFLGPLLRKSSEAYRNYSVIKSLRQSENLQVKDDLYNQRKAVVKITGDSMCSLCNKKIGTSVFAVYPNGKTLVHFVCFRDSQMAQAARNILHSSCRMSLPCSIGYYTDGFVVVSAKIIFISGFEIVWV
ncbi:hypothetical protein FNV43_RR17615 [Rhamnella rubrinervis]|uniref:CNH domain-containing protein n=1 Tax=Rhamnella rubrinervis TaxID=2594499 RepID=A0A8K0E3I0_9ROSA|nr:hypothetical protein FNV43_RR17615 [Rhamnella rubrinervis]